MAVAMSLQQGTNDLSWPLIVPRPNLPRNEPNAASFVPSLPTKVRYMEGELVDRRQATTACERDDRLTICCSDGSHDD